MDRALVISLLLMVLRVGALGAPIDASVTTTVTDEKHSVPSDELKAPTPPPASSVRQHTDDHHGITSSTAHTHITTAAPTHSSDSTVTTSPESKSDATALPVVTSTVSTTTKSSGFSFDWPLQNLFP